MTIVCHICDCIVIVLLYHFLYNYFLSHFSSITILDSIEEWQKKKTIIYIGFTFFDQFYKFTTFPFIAFTISLYFYQLLTFGYVLTMIFVKFLSFSARTLLIFLFLVIPAMYFTCQKFGALIASILWWKLSWFWNIILWMSKCLFYFLLEIILSISDRQE